jgi:nucleotide-binding universal stress UspA family protein
MFKHLLVPTDGSHLSQEAVPHAVSCAREAGGAHHLFLCDTTLAQDVLRHGVDL